MQELFLNQAGIFGNITNFLGDQGLQAIGALLILAIGILTRKYIVPLLKTELARQTASHLLIIADDVTDYFAEKFPGAHWSVWLDRAIDKIIEVTGVGRGPAERAAKAAISRKKARLAMADGKLEGRS
jgi:hypothetical protein